MTPDWAGGLSSLGRMEQGGCVLHLARCLRELTGSLKGRCEGEREAERKKTEGLGVGRLGAEGRGLKETVD